MSGLIYFRNWNGEEINKETFQYEDLDKPLVEFLNNQALSLIQGRVSTIKSLYNENKEFVGYYAISMSYIEAPSLYDEKRVATFPHPAVKIGRLLINKRHQGKGIGRAAIKHIIMIAQKLNEFVACRFIILDAKPHAVGFYEKVGFVVAGNARKRKDTVPMLFDLKATTFH